MLSVALSLGLPPPDVIRRRVSMEPGLSSALSGGRPADWHGWDMGIAALGQQEAIDIPGERLTLPLSEGCRSRG